MVRIAGEAENPEGLPLIASSFGPHGCCVLVAGESARTKGLAKTQAVLRNRVLLAPGSDGQRDRR